MRNVFLAAAMTAVFLSSPAPAVTIQIDYSYDWNGFFSSQDRRDELENAAATVGALVTDHLDAIQPGDGNTWDASVFDPSLGGTDTVTNLVVPADTIIVYVGARNLGGLTLAATSQGFNTPNGSPQFVDTVENRGQGVTTGTSANDFGPWGAAVSFGTQVNWSFSSGLPAANTYDFYSVALHELEHVLGFGTSASFANNISGQSFVGPASVAQYGGPVPLAPDQDHWGAGTTSDGAAAIMNATINTGERRATTPLDLAALSDIGWKVNAGALSTGDVNLDGIVNIQDVTLVADTWLSTDLRGDANHDGRVNIQDVTLIASHWLEGVGPGAGSGGGGSVSSVPEPSTFAIAGLGLFVWLTRSLRRRWIG